MYILVPKGIQEDDEQKLPFATRSQRLSFFFFLFFENKAFIHSIICKESWYKASTAGGGESSTQ